MKTTLLKRLRRKAKKKYKVKWNTKAQCFFIDGVSYPSFRKDELQDELIRCRRNYIELHIQHIKNNIGHKYKNKINIDFANRLNKL